MSLKKTYTDQSSMPISSFNKNGKKQPFNHQKQVNKVVIKLITTLFTDFLVYSTRGYRITLNNLHHHLTVILSRFLHSPEKHLYYSCNINRTHSLIFLKVKNYRAYVLCMKFYFRMKRRNAYVMITLIFDFQAVLTVIQCLRRDFAHKSLLNFFFLAPRHVSTQFSFKPF